VRRVSSAVVAVALLVAMAAPPAFSEEPKDRGRPIPSAGGRPRPRWPPPLRPAPSASTPPLSRCRVRAWGTSRATIARRGPARATMRRSWARRWAFRAVPNRGDREEDKGAITPYLVHRIEVLEGRGCSPAALSLASVHRSAWKGRSRKLVGKVPKIGGLGDALGLDGVRTWATCERKTRQGKRDEERRQEGRVVCGAARHPSRQYLPRRGRSASTVGLSPEGVRVLGEYWLGTENPRVIAVMEAQSMDTFGQIRMDWDDVFEIGMSRDREGCPPP
jgi:hypothetical protein